MGSKLATQETVSGFISGAGIAVVQRADTRGAHVIPLTTTRKATESP